MDTKGLTNVRTVPEPAFITTTQTITLALPKTALGTVAGTISLADIGIPRTLFERVDVEYGRSFGHEDWIELERQRAGHAPV
jgi:hypothetical protein